MMEMEQLRIRAGKWQSGFYKQSLKCQEAECLSSNKNKQGDIGRGEGRSLESVTVTMPYRDMST